MSLRRFMHPRNRYKVEPNFQELASLYPEFHKHVSTDLTGKLKFNFKNDESLRILAKVLLKHDFGIEVEIPNEKLVPVLPLRLNYILWIEDLMKHANIHENISGVDIGTGAVCIYPLLCSKMFNWKMLGTEIDPSSVSSALQNVKTNKLDNLIKVTPVQSGRILKQVLGNSDFYSFTMCNPPFFNIDKVDKKEKKTPPRNASTGNKCELSVEGGERSFVLQIIEESIELSTNIKIYTTMLGQKTSLAFFRSELNKRNIENFTWTEFCQGHTKRWGLAWSFLSKETINLKTAPNIRTRDELSKKKSKDEFSTEFFLPASIKWTNLNDVVTSLKQWIQSLKMEIEELKLEEDDFDGWACHLRAYEDSWSHARRKRRMELREASQKKKICLEPSEHEDVVVNMASEESSFTQETNSEPKQLYLEFSLIISKLESIPQIHDDMDDLKMRVSLIYQGGEGGKSGLETFRQFLINKFDIREFFQKHNRGKSGKSPKKRTKKK